MTGAVAAFAVVAAGVLVAELSAVLDAAPLAGVWLQADNNTPAVNKLKNNRFIG